LIFSECRFYRLLLRELPETVVLLLKRELRLPDG
jgi:hypothetical protein